MALPSVRVDAGVTSISLLTQTPRTLATPANVVRAIDAVTAKPETAETLTVSAVALAARLGRLGLTRYISAPPSRTYLSEQNRGGPPWL
jgi:hypothetical protein